jgi:hypothetical protein
MQSILTCLPYSSGTDSLPMKMALFTRSTNMPHKDAERSGTVWMISVLQCHFSACRFRVRPCCAQVIQAGIEDPCEASAAVAAANAALEDQEDDWPGLRPPRKRQKLTRPPGEPEVRHVVAVGAYVAVVAICLVCSIASP